MTETAGRRRAAFGDFKSPAPTSRIRRMIITIDGPAGTG